MKKPVKIFLLLIAIIGITAISAGIIMLKKTHADLSKVKPDFILSANELFSQFENNEVSFGEKYINTILEITGEVGSIDKSEDETINISLKTDSPFAGIICTFQKIPGDIELNKGDIITIRGECSGMLMDILLNNCALL
jgi:hypothetical protein